MTICYLSGMVTLLLAGLLDLLVEAARVLIKRKLENKEVKGK